MKIYTRTGDAGDTQLLGGSRVGKQHPRVQAYGEIDELNALLGVIRSCSEEGELSSLLSEIQRDLFALGAQLADPRSAIGTKRAKADVGPEHVRRLESAIDTREAALPELHAFILPGGSSVGALLHLARTVCRRAERSTAALSRETPVDSLILAYLNRLSDLLFVLARKSNHDASRPEETW